MSDENQEVEQITKNPLPAKSGAKEKDPKKVAAGKKLAENNRKAKEALAREMKREVDRSREEEQALDGGTTEGQAWIPELSFTTVLSLVGIGFTAVDMFMRYYRNRGVNIAQVPTHAPESIKESPPSKIPIPQTTGRTPMGPKIGMH